MLDASLTWFSLCIAKIFPPSSDFLIEWIIISCLIHYKPLVWRAFKKYVVPLICILDYFLVLIICFICFTLGRMKWNSDHFHVLLCMGNKFNFAIISIIKKNEKWLCVWVDYGIVKLVACRWKDEILSLWSLNNSACFQDVYHGKQTCEDAQS